VDFDSAETSTVDDTYTFDLLDPSIPLWGCTRTDLPGADFNDLDLRRRLEPLARTESPLNIPPPRKTRFGSPLVLSRVHWVEPKLVAEITYLTWTADNLLRQTVYAGLREDKPADQVRREAAR